MRLDRYLVLRDFFESRSRAKRAIENGWVRVDGSVVTSPSEEIKRHHTVEVDEGSDRPGGYFKLRDIDDKVQLIESGDRVLDLGSSAGGFAEYAVERGAYVICVEHANEFSDTLTQLEEEEDRIEFIEVDAFELDVSEVGEVDVILNDVSLEIEDSLYLIERFMGNLRDDARVLQVVKSGTSELPESVRKELQVIGVEVDEVLDAEEVGTRKREVYVIGRKNSAD